MSEDDQRDPTASDETKIVLKRNGYLTINDVAIPRAQAVKLEKKSDTSLTTVTLVVDASEVEIEICRNDFEW